MRQTAVWVLFLGAGLLMTGAPGSAGEKATPTPAPTARPSAERTPVVITNETLGKYSGQGHITEVSTSSPTPAAARPPGKRDPSKPFRWEEPAAGAAPAPADQQAADDAARDEDEQRRYWRGLYEQQVELLGSIKDQIDGLDREIPGLWRDFYSRDDPMYRDGVIKPKLDEALERRQRLEERLGQEQERLPQILDRARHAGARPDWFRGLERPTPAAAKTPGPGDVKPEDLGGVGVVDPDQT